MADLNQRQVRFLKLNAQWNFLDVQQIGIARHQHGMPLSKQIAVRPGALKADVRVIFRERVNQNPIRFNVAIAAAGKISPQRMVLVSLRQSLAVNQEIEHHFEFRQILAPPGGKLDILLELAGPAYGSHNPKSV
jgi:hypothetical protein